MKVNLEVNLETEKYFAFYNPFSGKKEIEFSSNYFPKSLNCTFLGKTRRNKKYYDLYVADYVTEPVNLEGMSQYILSTTILDGIASLFQGKSEDGRVIVYARALTINDINKFLAIKLTKEFLTCKYGTIYDSKILYKFDGPNGNSGIFSLLSKCIPFQKRNYTYNVDILKKTPDSSILNVTENFWINSKTIDVSRNTVSVGLRSYSALSNSIGFTNLCKKRAKGTSNYSTSLGIRPVIYLEHI